MPRMPSGERVPSMAVCSIRSCGLADIERADRHSPRRRTLHELTIGAVLRLFGQGRLATAREQELGAEQTNARRSTLRCARRIVRGLDVRLESNLDAVLCDCRQIAILVERLFVRLTPPLPCVYQVQRFGIRIGEDLARRAIHRHDRARRDENAGVVQARRPPVRAAIAPESPCDSSSFRRR